MRTPPGVRAVERDVAVAKTAADADGGDPVPWTLDPPAGDIADGRRHSEEPEPGIDVRAEVHVRVVAADTEQHEERSGAAPDPDRKAPDLGASGACSRAGS